MFSSFRRQIRAFLATIQFLTWLPVPRYEYEHSLCPLMAMYFPLVGALVGTITALALWGAHTLFPGAVAVAIAMLIQGWVTGAFHEDALADVADGMGGLDAEKRLQIMKDSAIGTYGAFALILFLLIRYQSISTVPLETACRNFIAFSAASRLSGVFFLTISPPIHNVPGLSKSVFFYHCWKYLIISVFFATSVVLIVQPVPMLWIPVVVFGLPLLLRGYFLQRLGGVNGDCAGCVVYVSETILYVLATIS